MAYSVAGDKFDDSLDSSMEKGAAALEYYSYRMDIGLTSLHVRRPLGNAARGTPSSDDGSGSHAAAEDGVITRTRRG